MLSAPFNTPSSQPDQEIGPRTGKEAKGPGIFFEGFHELRAVAALAVIVHHVELMKYREHMPSLVTGPNPTSAVGHLVAHFGKNGVFLFFVLSGFLITYLLLAERARFGRIDIRNFYIRRVLRIWPLYYLIVGLAFLVVPMLPEWFPFLKKLLGPMGRIRTMQSGFGMVSLPYYLLFLINICPFPPILGAAQAWSVAVEEQFYLFWPWLFRFFYRILPWIFGGIILMVYLGNNHLPSSQYSKFLVSFFYYTRFDLMALGGLIAWGVFHQWLWLVRLLSSPVVAWAATATVAWLLCQELRPLPIGLCFGVIIGHFSLKGRRIKALALLRKGGEISYGLYMFHPIVLFVTLGIMVKVALPHADRAWFHIALYALTLGLTWSIAWASYWFFEKPFLRFKHLFERVKTGKHAM